LRIIPLSLVQSLGPIL